MTRGRGSLLLATAAVAAIAAGGAPAFSADLAYKAQPAPLVEAWNPWMIRIRAVGVIPNNGGGGTVYIPDPATNAALAGLGRTANPIPGDALSVSTTVIPEIDISYFFTPNIALELILGVTPHKVTGQGQLSGLDVGQTWLLPPTLTLQYHFTNFGAFKPYVGAGVNYTVFFNNSGSNIPAIVPLTAAPLGATATVTNLSVENQWSPALQVGFDYMVTKNVGVNFDVKRLFLRPDWSGAISIGGGLPLPMNGKVDIDPWLVGGGVTYKF